MTVTNLLVFFFHWFQLILLLNLSHIFYYKINTITVCLSSDICKTSHIELPYEICMFNGKRCRLIMLHVNQNKIKSQKMPYKIPKQSSPDYTAMGQLSLLYGNWWVS